MIGLDTNILIRYLTQDEPLQFEAAASLIESHQAKSNSMFINNIVLCEIVWVLGKGYKYSREQIHSVLKMIATTEEFCFENLEIILESISELGKSSLDFSDILISKINKNLYNCQITYSFDKNTSSIKGFKVLL